MANELCRLRRGEMLRVLYRNSPHPVGDNLLAAIFTDTTIAKIQRHLHYLQDKGYVKLEPVSKEYSTATVLVAITSAGIDLLEGSAPPDPGIVSPPL